jgi:hypothetical protein
MCRWGRMSKWACGAIALIGLSSSASAQVLTSDKWHFAVTPYMWLTGLVGDVGVGRLGSTVDLSPGDILKQLQFGIMAAGEARKGPYVLGLDAIYAKLGDARAFAVRGDSGALDLTQHETIIQPTGGYTIGDSTWSVDFLVGIRYWNLSTSLDVTGTRLSNERSMTQQWVDATGGARFNWMPLEKLHFVAAADGGGGGSKDSWQAYSSLGYDVWSKWRLGLAYRVLAVDYDRNNFLFDTRTKGFVVGATYHTW